MGSKCCKCKPRKNRIVDALNIDDPELLDSSIRRSSCCDCDCDLSWKDYFIFSLNQAIFYKSHKCLLYLAEFVFIRDIIRNWARQNVLPTYIKDNHEFLEFVDKYIDIDKRGHTTNKASKGTLEESFVIQVSESKEGHDE